MKSIKELIEEYHSSSSDRIQIIEELEFVESEEKWPFILEILSDGKTDDLEKIFLFKILEIYDVPEKYLNAFAISIENTILNEEDWDIRNYAVTAMKKFIANDAIVSLVKKLILDKNEDTDIRWNAFSALKPNVFGEFKKVKNKKILDDILKRLQCEKAFEKAVDRLYDYMNKKL